MRPGAVGLCHREEGHMIQESREQQWGEPES